MAAPYLSPRFHSTPEALAAVGLDVRVGSARPARYPFTGSEFTVGGAQSCDLRLTGAHLPAHICRLVRGHTGELQFYRIDPAFPIVSGGQSVGDAPIVLRHGDRIAVGPLDLTVHFADVHLHPQLERDRPTLRRNAERDALEAECEELRAEARRLAAQLPDLDAQRDELEAVRAELDGVRERLHAQFREKRDALAAEADALSERRREFEAELAERVREVVRRERELAEQPEPEPEPPDWATRLAELADREAAFQAQLDDAAKREAAVAATRAVLSARGADVAQHELAIASREAALAEQAKSVELRLASIEADAERTGREASDLEAHARGVAEEAHRLETLAIDLGQRESELSLRLAALNERSEQHDGDLVRREQELAARIAELDERSRLSDGDAERGEEQARRQAELAARESAIALKEESIERQGQKLREVGRAVVAAKRELHLARDEFQTERAGHAESVAQAQAGFEALRQQLAPLQAETEALRDALTTQATSLEDRESALETAVAEHRLAVAGFRAQVLAWQDEAEAERPAPVVVSPPPPPAESPLVELREWYRRRFRDVAHGFGPLRTPLEAPDTGDKQLAQMLGTHQLADTESVNALLAEAQRVRRPLRAVLLTGGAATLYQLAMIESGNLEALALGRLRVIDRVRVTPREVVYRVSDPSRGEGPNRGVYLLRHLAEAEMDDAVRPDEFRQRFSAAREATHLHLAQVADVLEIHGRPAALCEQPPGTPSGDWPAEAAHPGVWVRLLEGAAAGLGAAHRHGLAHGRLSSESFVLTPAGELKVVGVGEPMWLSTGVAAALDPTPAADLRALGPVSFGWAQLAQPPGKRRTRGKAFPEPLLNVVRRLESDPETPMADTATGAVPYESMAELLAELSRLASQFPCPASEWDRLVSHAAAARPEGVRQSA